MGIKTFELEYRTQRGITKTTIIHAETEKYAIDYFMSEYPIATVISTKEITKEN